MKIELLQISLLWAITLVGFSVAINARAPVRVTLSYFCAILCLCGSVFHTIQYGMQESAANASVIEAPATLPEPAPMNDVVIPAAVDTLGLAASKHAAALGEASNELKQTLELAKRLADRLAGVDLTRVSDLSDAEYDAMQNKAFGFRSDVGKVKERLAEASLKMPPELKTATTKIQNAVGELAQAVQAYDRFFKAENDQEEADKQQNFQRLTQSALSALKQAEIEIAAP